MGGIVSPQIYLSKSQSPVLRTGRFLGVIKLNEVRRAGPNPLELARGS